MINNRDSDDYDVTPDLIKCLEGRQKHVEYTNLPFIRKLLDLTSCMLASGSQTPVDHTADLYMKSIRVMLDVDPDVFDSTGAPRGVPEFQISFGLFITPWTPRESLRLIGNSALAELLILKASTDEDGIADVFLIWTDDK